MLRAGSCGQLVARLARLVSLMIFGGSLTPVRYGRACGPGAKTAPTRIWMQRMPVLSKVVSRMRPASTIDSPEPTTTSSARSASLRPGSPIALPEKRRCHLLAHVERPHRRS